VTVRAEVLSADDRAWPDLLAGHRHDVYHLPGYARLDAAGEGERAVAVHVTDGDLTLFLPLVLQPLPPALGADGRLRDARSPYGYPVPLVLDHGGDVAADRRRDFLGRAVPALVRQLRELDVVSAFVRLHPLPHLGLPAAPLEQAGTVVRHGESVWVDLTQSEEALRAQLRTNHKRDIAKLARDGFVGAVEEDWAALEDLREIYADTMDRVSARAFYRRSEEFFARMAALGVFRIATVRLAGRVVAAGLFSEVAGIVQYYLGGTFRDHLSRSPAKLMLLSVQQWARERGDVAYNLGSGSGWGGAENPLLRFKLGFSPLVGPVASWRVVADPGRYATLAQTASGGCPADAVPGGTSTGPGAGFFPAYRAQPATG
jgi:hypothetical protein